MPRKKLTAKYQIGPNLFAMCRLDVQSLNEDGLTTYIGIRREADTTLPLGVKLYIPPEQMNRHIRVVQTPDAFQEITAQVVEVTEAGHQQTLHKTSTLHRSFFPDRRQEKRLSCFFQTVIGNNTADVVDGNTSGLTLTLKSKRFLTNLNQGMSYPLTVNRKGSQYEFPGSIQHIHYNWQTFEHRIGFTLDPLTKDQANILMMMLDPDFKITLAEGVVDAGSGKIST